MPLSVKYGNKSYLPVSTNASELVPHTISHNIKSWFQDGNFLIKVIFLKQHVRVRQIVRHRQVVSSFTLLGQQTSVLYLTVTYERESLYFKT